MIAQSWMKTALKERGLKLKDVATALSITPPRVTDIVKGMREVQSDEVLPLAQLLGISAKSLLASLEAGEKLHAGQDGAGPSLPVLGGLTGTGQLVPPAECGTIQQVAMPPDAASPEGLHCYIMADDSLDAEIKRGSLIIAGDPRLHFFPIVPGSIYIIRTKDGGLTARQLHQADNGEMWMVPRPSSPNPAYKSLPFSMLPAMLDPTAKQKQDSETVRSEDIIAAVMWVHRRLTPDS